MKLFKETIKLLFYFLAQFFPPRGPVILTYHSISDDNDEFFTVTPAEFERQISFLKKAKYNVMSLSDFVDRVTRRSNIPHKTVVITFDDGYEDNYLYAWPILRKYNFPAAIFIVTGIIGRERKSRKGRRMKMLQWDQIKEMDSAGLIEFYPHSHNHEKLTSLTEANSFLEIEQSKNVLIDHLHKRSDIFAYPYGAFNDVVMNAVKKVGFRAALTVRPGALRQVDNLLMIPRNSIDSKISFPMFRGIVRFGRI